MEDKDKNRGVLFKNDRKESDNHPDYKGHGNLDGIEFWQSAWINKSKDGKTYMSFSYQYKDSTGETVTVTDEVELDDTVPF